MRDALEDRLAAQLRARSATRSPTSCRRRSISSCRSRGTADGRGRARRWSSAAVAAAVVATVATVAVVHGTAGRGTDPDRDVVDDRVAAVGCAAARAR